MKHIRFLPFICLLAALNPAIVSGHGPQIQITNDNNQIVTRRLHLDGPYGTAQTDPISVYVMPIAESSNVWYSHPNGEISDVTMLPAFPSGPGFAYGHGYDPNLSNTQRFETDSTLSVEFTAGLRRWNGAAFVDAGDAQWKAFRGSDPNIATPSESFAVTSDVGPFDSLSLPAVAEGYGSEAAEVHNSLRWALLGDGVSPTSASPDGVYLLSLRLVSTQSNLVASNEFYFVLHKNAAPTDVAWAVSSLQLPSNVVQYVPEPSGVLACGIAGVLLTGGVRRRGRSGRTRKGDSQ